MIKALYVCPLLKKNNSYGIGMMVRTRKRDITERICRWCDSKKQGCKPVVFKKAKE